MQTHIFFKNQAEKNKNPKLTKAAALQQLHQAYAELEQHPFADFAKTKIVFGTGNIDSPLIFLGEGPGREEDIQGEPFVGRAGQLLNQMIKAMGFSRQEVYITNVIKCRLPENRAPSMDEIDIEKRLILDEELAILGPKIICALGSSAMWALLGPGVQISKNRGQIFDLPRFKVAPTYHPAYLLRNPAAKSAVWRDLQAILIELKHK
jgi:DNA polymerase